MKPMQITLEIRSKRQRESLFSMNVKDQYVLLLCVKRKFWPTGHWSLNAASFLETVCKTGSP